MGLIESYTRAAAISGRNIMSLIREALQLRMSAKRLGLTEYIDFQLYLSDLPWKTKLTFGGQRAQAAVEEMLIDDYSRFLSLDKITMYALLSGFGFPIPTVRATYRSIRPSHHFQLQSKEDLVHFLSIPQNLPIYFKRSFGSYGRGNAVVVACDGNRVTLGNDTTESIDQFANSLDDSRSLGWILQEPLTAHASIATLTGSQKISGLRVHTFMGKTQPRVTKIIFKLNAGLRDSDNFEHGVSGNMLASVDIGSGKIRRAISGVGLNQVEILAHPKTGIKLIGFEIPNWTDVILLVNDSQKAFPGFLCPGWDIALCDDGPKILEVNAFGDIDLSQHAYRSSFFDEDFIACLRDRGLAELLDKSSGKGTRSKLNNRVGVQKHHWQW